MATFATLPSELYGCICSYLSSNCILSVASTTRELRAHFLKSLSKREPVKLLSGRVSHERIGPYIGKVAVAVDAEMEDALYDTIRRICHLGALESLTVGEELLMLGGCRRPPFEDWEWLSVVTEVLRGGRKLSRLSEVHLNCFFGAKTVGYRFDPMNNDEEGEEEEDEEVAGFREFHIPPASSRLLKDFLSALPPSVTKLRLGPLSSVFGVHHSGLSPKAEAGLFQLLREGALPRLQELNVAVHLSGDAFDGLVNALCHGPFASTLERLTLADGTGCRHHPCASNYAGPTDLTPLLQALGNCPNLRSITLGRGRCDAKHFSAFMDLVLEGPLSRFDRVPTPTDLPVAFATVEEMEAALSSIGEALVRGRFKGTQVLTLGGDTAHLPLPDASLAQFLLATRGVDLPCITTLSLAAHFEPRTLAMLGAWVARRPSLTRLFLHCVGQAIPPQSRKEDLLVGLMEHFVRTPALEVLEVAWEKDADTGAEREASDSMQLHEGDGEEAPPLLPSVERSRKPRCCMLNGLHELLRHSRRPKSGCVIEVALVTAVVPESEGAAGEGKGGICRSQQRMRTVVSMRRILEAELCWSVGMQESEAEFFMPYMPKWEEWLCQGGEGGLALTDYRLVLRESGSVESITVSLRVTPKPGTPLEIDVGGDDSQDEEDEDDEDMESDDDEDYEDDEDETDMDSDSGDEVDCDCC